MTDDDSDDEQSTADGTENEDADEEDEEEELFEEQKAQVQRPVLRLFREYGTEHPLAVGVGLGATVLSPLLGLAPTYLLKVIIDAALQANAPYELPLVPGSVVPETQWGQIVFSAGLIVAITGLNALLSWANDWGWQLFSQHAQHDIRTSAYEKMQRLGMEFFTNQRTGQILSILNNDVNGLDTFLTRYVRNIIRITTQFVGVAVILLGLNWQLALVALVPIPVMGWISYTYGSRVREKYGEIRQRVGELNSQVENSVSGITVVKSYTNEPYEAERVEDASEDYFDARWDMITTRVRFFPLLRFVNWVGFALILLVGGYWITVGPPPLFSGTLTVGTLVAFLTYNQQITMPIVQIGYLLDNYEEARAKTVRVFGLVDYPVAVTEREDAVDLEPVRGRVEVEDVTFGYPTAEETVLDGVSVAAEPGEMVGLVGPTGSGKTTLIKLLLRFYDPDEGEVRIDGRDLRDVSLSSLRESIGYVSQDPFLFDGTVEENLRYANLEADDEELRRAAKVANAHEFVTDLDEGYETQVGERGVKLSGGQRQRVAIARAVLKDPEILVLDEATSHVDNETEVLIQNSLAALVENRTTFAIAHRLSTVRDADRIVVMDDAEVIEQGSHEELLEREGLYANLWRVQVGELDDLPEEFVEQTAEGLSD